MDISARKLQVWIQKVVLSVRPGTEQVDKKDDGDEETKSQGPPVTGTIEVEGEDKIDPIEAVVKIKIPKVPKEPELDENGEEIPDNGPESDLEDIPFEDKCL